MTKRIFLLLAVLAFSYTGISLVFAAPEKPKSSVPVAAKSAENVSYWEKQFSVGLVKAGQKSGNASREHLKRLNGKFVGFYYSAKFCHFCHQFTPELIKFYKKNKADFEVVFVSQDETEEEMIAYSKSSKMPWLVVPFDKIKEAPIPLTGLPGLLVYAPDGKFFAKLSGANTKEKSDSRLHKDLREKMNVWKEAHK